MREHARWARSPPRTTCPSLLITDAPREVGSNEAFTLKVSTRNLVRDRFLGAAAAATTWRARSSKTACSAATSTPPAGSCPRPATAPDAGQDPEFFLATQDSGGGADPRHRDHQRPGHHDRRQLQCTSWAGDGSHRTPMMSAGQRDPGHRLGPDLRHRPRPAGGGRRGRRRSRRARGGHGQRDSRRSSRPGQAGPGRAAAGRRAEARPGRRGASRVPAATGAGGPGPGARPGLGSRAAN